MADNQNTNPTPQQTPRPAAPQPAPAPRPEPTATVSEIKPVARENANTAEPIAQVSENNGSENTANVNETPTYDTLSVSEQQDYLNILEEKNKRGLLSVDEQAVYNKAKEEQNKKGDKKIADAGSKDGDENQDPDPEKKGPFKEKDVIKYMYEDWLLEGANWLWTKTAAKLDKGYYWAQRKMLERMREKQIEKGKTYETETRYNQIEDHALSSGQANSDLIDKHQEEQLKNLKLIKEGKLNEAKVSDSTKVLLANMDEKEKQQFFKVAEQGIKNFYENMAIAEQFASNYARAGMTLDLAKDKDYYQGKDLKAEFDKQKAHAMQLFARRMDMEAANGGNPAKLAAKLFNSSQSAVKEAQKTMSKRKFTERDKKPRGDLAVEVVALSDELKKVATPEPGQKRGLYEAAVADMDFDKGSSASMEEVNRAFAANLVQKDQNNERRDRVALLKQKLGLTDENIDTFTKIYKDKRHQVENIERNQRMADSLSGVAALGRIGTEGR